MSNTHETLPSLFSDIADAIREKTDSTVPIVADTFPSAIRSIPTGANIRTIPLDNCWIDNGDSLHITFAIDGFYAPLFDDCIRFLFSLQIIFPTSVPSMGLINLVFDSDVWPTPGMYNTWAFIGDGNIYPNNAYLTEYYQSANTTFLVFEFEIEDLDWNNLLTDKVSASYGYIVLQG